MGIRPETVVPTIISVNQLSIYGAVSHLSWRIQLLSNKNREDLSWAETIWPTCGASRLIDNDTPHPRLRFPHKKAQRTSGKPSTTRSIDKSLYWCRIPENSWSRTILHDKHTDESTQFAAPVTCREKTLPRDENSSDPKCWTQGNTKNWGPYWKSQSVTYKVNMEWKSELNLGTKTILTRGSEFLMALNKLVIGLDRQEVRQRAGDLYNEDGSICVRQKRMSNVADSGEEHSIILGNVHGCDDECGDIHVK